PDQAEILLQLAERAAAFGRRRRIHEVQLSIEALVCRERGARERAGRVDPRPPRRIARPSRLVEQPRELLLGAEEEYLPATLDLEPLDRRPRVERPDVRAQPRDLAAAVLLAAPARRLRRLVESRRAGGHDRRAPARGLRVARREIDEHL